MGRMASMFMGYSAPPSIQSKRSASRTIVRNVPVADEHSVRKFLRDSESGADLIGYQAQGCGLSGSESCRSWIASNERTLTASVGVDVSRARGVANRI
jgi:hypothetical protein